MPVAVLPGFTISYAHLEAALVEMHGIAANDVPAFRSRFGALQRGGLFGAGNQPGKGRKLVYGVDQFHRAVLAFELVQAGVGPTTVLWLVREFWDKRLRDILLNAERGRGRETSNVVLLLTGLTAMEGAEQAVPSINHTTMDKLATTLSLAIRGDDEQRDRDPPARALVVNLSAQLRRFHTALVNHHLKPEMLAELEVKPNSRRVTKGRRGATGSS
ncbi:hypothetical protein [Bradyrhizobium sp. UFLA05-112]